MQTTLDPQVTDPYLELEPPKEAHIVARGDDGTPAGALILEGSVNGTPVEALCGLVFVPTRDPLKLPPCQRCKEAVETIMEFRSL